MENQLARVMVGREPPPAAASSQTTMKISSTRKMKTRVVAHTPPVLQATYLNRTMVEVDLQATAPFNIQQRYSL